MGRYACRVAAQLDVVTELVIADLNGDRAVEIASRLGPGVTALALDLTDGAALDAALSRVDVVLNTAGPFFRFGVPVLTAALRMQCHYLDICDDWEPALQMLDLGEEAARRGVTALIGIGASPGITNLLAVVAARELDLAQEIITGWNIGGAHSEGAVGAEAGAALAHGIQQVTGMIRVLRDGERIDERPLRLVDVDYPGVGLRRSWTFGHPEPLTLPRALGDVVSSVNVVHGSHAALAVLRALGWAVDHQVLKSRLAVRTASLAERSLPSPRPKSMFSPKRMPPLFGLAAGLHEGRPASVGLALCRMPGRTMGAMTGIPLAVALELLSADGFREHGVFTPEEILDPDRFFPALARHCPGGPNAREMVTVTRSWDPGASRVFRTAMLDARAWAAAHAYAAGRWSPG
jgi:saccharopine dehydrogenase-like NADP-dependent oxidoreductase